MFQFSHYHVHLHGWTVWAHGRYNVTGAFRCYISFFTCMHAQTQTRREKLRLTTAIIFRHEIGLCNVLVKHTHKNLTSDIFISLVN